MKCFLGIDLGGTAIKYSLYTENGEPLREGGQVATPQESAQDIIDSLSAIIEKYPDIDGMGLSMPGRIDVKAGIVHRGGSLRVLKGIKLQSILKERHKIPIAIENDANCAALAELWLGNGKDCDNFVCVTLGTGTGGGVVIDKKIYRGNHYFSGEFSHVYANPETMQLLNYTSTSALLKDINAQTLLKISEGREVFDNLDNPQVFSVYNAWIRKLAVGIYNIGAIFDPEKILLGGGISAQERIYSEIESVIQSITNEYYDRLWVVEPCRFRNDAGKIGAVYNLKTLLDREDL